MTPGKLAGMKAVSNDRGVIAAAAMDQRGSLKKSLAKEKGAEVGDREMEEFKVLVTEVLTQHASAILLDPEWGLPASKRRAKGSGLLLAYEKTGYDANTPGRLPDLVIRTMQEFTKDRYGVDVMKVEVPINMKFVEGAKSTGGQTAYSRKEAMDHFRRSADVSTKPFIYLSAGVSNPEFSETLELA